MYLSDKETAAIIASSEILSLWCSSYFALRPLIISIDSSIEGSSINTGWNLLSNAASFSTYFHSNESSFHCSPPLSSQPKIFLTIPVLVTMKRLLPSSYTLMGIIAVIFLPEARCNKLINN